MLGYKFIIKENTSNVLKELLSNINLNKYYVFIKEDEIIPDSISSLDNNSLFRNRIFKYLDFSKELESKKYQCIFMRIERHYPVILIDEIEPYIRAFSFLLKLLLDNF